MLFGPLSTHGLSAASPGALRAALSALSSFCNSNNSLLCVLPVAGFISFKYSCSKYLFGGIPWAFRSLLVSSKVLL
jgi:hypothetical protein